MIGRDRDLDQSRAEQLGQTRVTSQTLSTRLLLAEVMNTKIRCRLFFPAFPASLSYHAPWRAADIGSVSVSVKLVTHPLDLSAVNPLGNNRKA